MHVRDVRLYTVEERADGPANWWEVEPMADPFAADPEYGDRTASWMGPGEDPFVIELEADDGTVGIASGIGGPYACAVVDSHYRRFLEGSDPFAVARTWERMYRAGLPSGSRGVGLAALSGVDLALWDLVGTVTDRPVYDLIGGRTTDAVPCYVTTHPSVVEHVAGRGFEGVKLSGPWGPAEGYRAGLDALEADVAGARETLDHHADLMIDAYMAWDREFLLRAADRLRPYDPKWIEDPLLPDALDRYRDLGSRLGPVGIAVGNLEVGHEPFHRALAAGVADVLQPDPRLVGGMTAMRRIAASARPYGVPVYPHTSGVYGYHFVLAHTNAPWAEFIVPGDGRELRPFLAGVTGEPVPTDGSVALPDDPGFGLSLDRTVLEPY
jgi:L-alanine-DL-glutamate epimerase-like enolase superfamily enzyme